MLEDVRKTFRAEGEDDPLGDKPSDEISKKKLDALLAKGDPEAGAVVQSAIENFAQQFASVIKRFLKTQDLARHRMHRRRRRLSRQPCRASWPSVVPASS